MMQTKAVLLLLLHLLAPPPAAAATAEAACEGKGLTQPECTAVGCCEWDDGACWSATDGECGEGGGGGGTSGTAALTADPSTVKLPTYAAGARAHAWAAGAGMFKACGKTTTVFGVYVCASAAAWSASQDKCNHIADVVAQLLDNDGDGVADDAKVVQYMVARRFYMIVPNSERDLETMGDPPDSGTGQMTGIWEAVPGSCDTPSNRGASNTNRSTWAAAVGNTPGATGCKPERDATTEEVLHLITTAAGKLWPTKWGPTKTSTAGAAAFAMNGVGSTKCGWGYLENYKNPAGASPACTGMYAYDDPTCDSSCVVVEGIYWASVAWMGGLMTNDRAASVAQEWQATVPDKSMQLAVPSGQANAKTLEEGSQVLFDLVRDTTSDGHKWLPKIMPDGKYKVTAANAKAASGNTATFYEDDGAATGLGNRNGGASNAVAMLATAMAGVMLVVCTAEQFY